MTQFGKRLPGTLPPAPETSPPALEARLLLPGGEEQSLMVTALDPDGGLFLTPQPLAPGTPLTALIEEIGRIDGRAGEAAPNGMWVSFDIEGARRQRLIRHLRWLVRRERGEAEALRRHTRFEPRNRHAAITLPGGRAEPCEVIDISLSGAGLRAAQRPGIGAPVSLGGIRARVVRHLPDGFAIEFLAALSQSDLDSALG